MPKKSIIAVLCTIVCLVFASVALVLTSEFWTNADSGEVLIDTAYLDISADGKTLNGFTIDGKNYVKNLSSYKVVVPNRVTNISNVAFNECSGLTSITLPSSLTSIGNCAFMNCTSLASIEIPFKVNHIGYRAFEGCKNLTSIEIPASVSRIDNATFNYCYNLTSVVLQNGVKTIGNSAFWHCTGLTSIIIPASVIDVEVAAFAGCVNLNQIIVQNFELMDDPNLAEYKDSGILFYEAPEVLSKENDRKNNIGLIAAISGGSVLGLGVIITIVVMIKKRKKLQLK